MQRINLEDLPERYQKQVLEQLARQQKRTTPPAPESPTKAKKGPPQSEVDYYNRFVLPGLMCGEIVKVLDRRRFELMPAAEFCGIKLPAAHYTPDFILQHKDGTVEIVEVKSRFTRKQQRDYIYRRRLFIEKYARPNGWKFTEYIQEENND